jgi:hypothetical protein
MSPFFGQPLDDLEHIEKEILSARPLLQDDALPSGHNNNTYRISTSPCQRSILVKKS